MPELQALVISLKGILCTNILCTRSEFDFSFGKHVFIFSPACSWGGMKIYWSNFRVPNNSCQSLFRNKKNLKGYNVHEL